MSPVLTVRTRPALPPISHLDLEKIKTDRPDSSRFPAMNGLNISTAPLGSPSSAYSGAPPPYSYAPSVVGSANGPPGYISPPESTTRRSTRDDKDSPPGRTSLPSIHEALGDKHPSFSTPLSATAPILSGSTPSTAVSREFPDPPKSILAAINHPPPTFRDNPFSSQTHSIPPPPPPDLHQTKSNAGPATEPRPSSPRSGGTSSFRPHFPTPSESAPSHSPLHPERPQQPYTFSSLSTVPPHGHTSEPHHFSSGSKYDHRPPLSRSAEASYGETVKRHLDVYDAEIGFNEVSNFASASIQADRIDYGRVCSDSRFCSSLGAKISPRKPYLLPGLSSGLA
jgi:hypothetical protein